MGMTRARFIRGADFHFIRRYCRVFQSADDALVGFAHETLILFIQCRYFILVKSTQHIKDQPFPIGVIHLKDNLSFRLELKV